MSSEQDIVSRELSVRSVHPSLESTSRDRRDRLFPSDFYELEEERLSGDYAVPDPYSEESIKKSLREVFLGCMHLMSLKILFSVPSWEEFYSHTADGGNVVVSMLVANPRVLQTGLNCRCSDINKKPCRCLLRIHALAMNSLLSRYRIDLSKKNLTYSGWEDSLNDEVNDCTGETLNSDSLIHRMKRALSSPGDWVTDAAGILGVDLQDIYASRRGSGAPVPVAVLTPSERVAVARHVQRKMEGSPAVEVAAKKQVLHRTLGLCRSLRLTVRERVEGISELHSHFTDSLTPLSKLSAPSENAMKVYVCFEDGFIPLLAEE